jgi:hypothetical protein
MDQKTDPSVQLGGDGRQSAGGLPADDLIGGNLFLREPLQIP